MDASHELELASGIETLADISGVGPRSFSRSSNCAIGYESSPPRKVSTSSGSSMWSTMMRMRMMNRKV